VEVGRHEELLGRQGAYHRLYEAQTKQLDALEGREDRDDEMDDDGMIA
jgi:ATP-binding cassette subfamily B protein